MKNVLMRFWYDLLQYLGRSKPCVEKPIPKLLKGDLVLHKSTNHVAQVRYSFVNPYGETVIFVAWLNEWNDPRTLKDADVIKMNY